ncbi:MAG: major facilitator transporter [Burkholderiales bacterium]|jgi:MFS family permease|nr:major facilitator transporter [Burkholderiales bacterium]
MIKPPVSYAKFTQYQKQIVAFACLILITGIMAMDFINPSLPYILRSLNVDESSTKLLIVFYMLGFGISQLFFGTFSDNYGRKKTVLLSYIISIIGIAWSGTANSIDMLYAARFVNGIGSGGELIVAMVIISDVCKESEQLKQAFSYYTMSSMMSPAIAPIVGGLIQQYSNNWKLCLVALLWVTLISGVIVQKFMPETHTIPDIKASMINQIREYLALFKRAKFMLYNFISAFILVFTISYYSYMPFILVKQGFSPAENGALYIVYAVGLALGSLSLAKYFFTFDSNRTFIACCTGFILASSLFCIYFYFSYSIVVLILFSMTIAFICGISAPLTLSVCMAGFAADTKGAASSVQSFTKIFFTALALLFFDFVPLHSMANLLLCYFLLSMVIAGLLIFDKCLLSKT